MKKPGRNTAILDHWFGVHIRRDRRVTYVCAGLHKGVKESDKPGERCGFLCSTPAALEKHFKDMVNGGRMSEADLKASRADASRQNAQISEACGRMVKCSLPNPPSDPDPRKTEEGFKLVESRKARRQARKSEGEASGGSGASSGRSTPTREEEKAGEPKKKAAGKGKGRGKRARSQSSDSRQSTPSQHSTSAPARKSARTGKSAASGGDKRKAEGEKVTEDVRPLADVSSAEEFPSLNLPQGDATWAEKLSAAASVQSAASRSTEGRQAVTTSGVTSTARHNPQRFTSRPPRTPTVRWRDSDRDQVTATIPWDIGRDLVQARTQVSEATRCLVDYHNHPSGPGKDALRQYLLGISQRSEMISSTLCQLTSWVNTWWKALEMGDAPTPAFAVHERQRLEERIQTRVREAARALVTDSNSRVQDLERQLTLAASELDSARMAHSAQLDHEAASRSRLRERTAKLEATNEELRTALAAARAAPPPPPAAAPPAAAPVHAPPTMPPPLLVPPAGFGGGAAGAAPSGVRSGGERMSLTPPPGVPPPATPMGRWVLCPPGARAFSLYPGEVDPAVVMLQGLLRVLSANELQPAPGAPPP